MKLLETRQDGQRLTGIVQYADGVREEYWFECGWAMTGSGSPWLAALLPLAATLGEPLEIPLPVDPLFLARADEILRLWRQWLPRMQVVAVTAPRDDRPAPRPEAIAAFFSAGVDSFFTALRYP